MATPLELGIQYAGAASFGSVIGWITYRTLRRREDKATLMDIATVLAAVGGGAVTALFQGPTLFGMYSLGLGGGFFGYLVTARSMEKAEDARRAAEATRVPVQPAQPGTPPAPPPAVPEPRTGGWMGR